MKKGKSIEPKDADDIDDSTFDLDIESLTGEGVNSNTNSYENVNVYEDYMNEQNIVENTVTIENDEVVESNTEERDTVENIKDDYKDNLDNK